MSESTIHDEEIEIPSPSPSPVKEEFEIWNIRIPLYFFQIYIGYYENYTWFKTWSWGLDKKVFTTVDYFYRELHLGKVHITFRWPIRRI